MRREKLVSLPFTPLFVRRVSKQVTCLSTAEHRMLVIVINYIF